MVINSRGNISNVTFILNVIRNRIAVTCHHVRMYSVYSLLNPYLTPL